jgi:hypothetical protein
MLNVNKTKNVTNQIKVWEDGYSLSKDVSTGWSIFVVSRSLLVAGVGYGWLTVLLGWVMTGFVDVYFDRLASIKVI